jgi:hypothetical protein
MSDEKQVEKVEVAVTAAKKEEVKKDDKKVAPVPVKKEEAKGHECQCHEKLEKFIEAICIASPSIARALKEKNLI